MSDSVRPHRRQPTRLPHPWDSPARTLEWVAISFSNAWKRKVKVKSFSRARLFVTPWTAAHQALLSMGFSRQQYWSGVPSPSPKDKMGGTKVVYEQTWKYEWQYTYSLKKSLYIGINKVLFKNEGQEGAELLLLLLSRFSCVQLCATP